VAAVVTDQDRLHLRRALQLAELGRGRVSPNPLVGAVLAREGRVIGEGYHAELGYLHAERAALEDCRRRGEEAAGATLYVTLEPCAHHGRQPPCAEAILESGVTRVIYASDDPSEKASGRGPGVLRDEGVEVEQAAGEEATAARLLNQAFRKHARTGVPLVTLKLAMSLDGRIATQSGDSKWISGEPSRELVHRWRAEADAVAVGIGTALADDPRLTSRGPEVHRQPARIVFDSGARLPLDSQLLRTLAEAPVIVVGGAAAPPERVSALERAGAEVVLAGGRERSERLRSALSELGRRGVTSLLVEGGAVLAGVLVAAGEVDQLRLFIAPILLGAGRAAVEGEGVAAVAEAARPLAVEAESIGEDLLIRARLREW
jgi:diaminohydroxyphosphoribosylaminopyrimidine deaminase / 5-amino-6-(5-phosphoribosylamino)uracil reductase